jgi:hypothetical protein
MTVVATAIAGAAHYQSFVNSVEGQWWARGDVQPPICVVFYIEYWLDLLLAELRFSTLLKSFGLS